MAEAVHQVLADESLSRCLSEAGIETARRYTWEAMVDKMEYILTSQ
jgi:glycosyltransferase involved in cell wall biosynthesis